MSRATGHRLLMAAVVAAGVATTGWAAAPVSMSWTVAPTHPEHNRVRNADFAQRGEDGNPAGWEFTTATPENFEVGWSEVGRGGPGSARILTRTGSMSGYFVQTVPVTAGERLMVLAYVRLTGGNVLLWLTGSPLMADGTRGRFDERFELPSAKSFFLAPTWIKREYLRGPDPERWVPVVRGIDIPAMTALQVGIGSYFARGEMFIDDVYAGPAQADLTVELTAQGDGRIASVEVVAVPGERLVSEAFEGGLPAWTHTLRAIDPEQGVVVRGSMADGQQFARRIYPPRTGRWEG